MSNFSSFGFSEPIIKAVTDMGFEKPTPIQAQSYPQLLGQETDFLGLAQTGTGKTAAFGLPMLELIDPTSPHIQAVILSPTRELSQQIAAQLLDFSAYLPDVKVVSVFGGAPIQGQIRQLKNRPQIIVGTPGRFIDFLNRGRINLDHLKVIILDEADEMLNMGFKEDMDEILSHVSGEKMTWLFSATMPKEIRRIISDYMTDPAEVQIIAEQQTNKNITHTYCKVKRADKTDALKRIVDVHSDMYAIIFCNTRADTIEVAKSLSKGGYKADFLNGDLSQAQRDAVMGRFKSKQITLLVATDVAARGIDVNDLTHVIHYRLPDHIENYTHRSGRTARAGKEGTSIALISGRDKDRVRRIERMLKISMEVYDIPRLHEVGKIRQQHWMQKVAEIDADDYEIDPETMQWIQQGLDQISKMELVRRLMKRDLGVGGRREQKDDLNDAGRSRDRKDRNGRRESRRDRERGERKPREKRVEKEWEKRRNSRKNDRNEERSLRDNGFKVKTKGRSYEPEAVNLPKLKRRAVQENMNLFTLDAGLEVIENKGHLLRLLCDKSGLSRSNFGDIHLDFGTCYVSVAHKYANQFKFRFNGTKVDGVKISVAPMAAGKGKKKKKKK